MCPGVSGLHKQVSSDTSCLQNFLQSWMMMLATETIIYHAAIQAAQPDELAGCMWH